MSDLVRFETEEEGQTVLVEVDEQTFGIQRASRDDDDVIRAGKRLESALAMIRPTARAVVHALSGMETDEQTIQFGIMLSGEVGAMIARTSAAAHFSVSLTWKTTPPEQDGGPGP